MPIEIQSLTPLLQVFDMPASLHFYRDLLGFSLISHSPPYDRDGRFHWALLRLNGFELMLNTAYDEGQQPQVPDPARVTAHQDTGIFFGCEDVDAAYNHLLAHGLDVKQPADTGYGMRQLYVTDPDRYSLCFQRRI